ncbi:MAG TPA: DUF6438 domain-containing protein [Flavobacteriales bacterium]
MRMLVSLLVPVALFACKGKERSTSVAGDEGNVQADRPVEQVGTPVVMVSQVPADSVFFQLERTPCFGSCPAFRVVVKGNGDATYVGQRFAPREGTYAGKITAAQMAELRKMADEVGFFGMDDRYDGQVTDLPSTIIRVSNGGLTKKVVGRVGPPVAFKEFAKFAEGLFEQVQWTLLEKAE